MEKLTWNEIVTRLFEYFEQCNASTILEVYNSIYGTDYKLEDFPQEEVI